MLTLEGKQYFHFQMAKLRPRKQKPHWRSELKFLFKTYSKACSFPTVLLRFCHHKSFLVLNRFLLKLNTLEQYETLRANVLAMPAEIQAGSKWRLGIDNYQGTAEGQGSHNQEKGEKL